MNATPGGPILFQNTMQITSGHLEDFKRAIRQAIKFVEDNGPQLMVEVFIDEQRMLAHSFQLYRDSESVQAHWAMSDPYIRDVMEHCTVQRLDVYGLPDEAVRDGVAQSAGEDITVTVTPWLTGFTRLPSPSAAPSSSSDRS